QPSSANLHTVMQIIPPNSQRNSRPPSSVGGRSLSGRSIGGRSNSGCVSSRSTLSTSGRALTLYDASITFAIASKSWRVYLRYDVLFIAAYPCQNGPHVLYNVYDYRFARPEKLTEI